MYFISPVYNTIRLLLERPESTHLLLLLFIDKKAKSAKFYDKGTCHFKNKTVLVTCSLQENLD